MGDFSGGPVVKTPCFHCQGQGFDPARETKIPCAMQRAKKKLCFFFKKGEAMKEERPVGRLLK